MLRRDSDLELNDDPSLQRRIWTLERIGWAGFGVVVLAALLGLLGSGGVLARAIAANEYARIDYPRVSRWQAGDEIVIELPPSTADRARIVLGHALTGSFEVERVHPPAARARLIPAGQELEFDAVRSGRTRVVLRVRATGPRLMLRAPIRVDDGPALSIRAVILP